MSGLILAHLGRHGEAAEILQSFLSVDDAQGDQDEFFASIQLEIATLLRDRQTVSRLYERLLPSADWYSPRGPIALFLGMGAAELGEAEQARELLGRALDVAAKVGDRPATALTHLQLAELLLEHYPDERPEAMVHLDFVIGEFIGVVL